MKGPFDQVFAFISLSLLSACLTSGCSADLFSLATTPPDTTIMPVISITDSDAGIRDWFRAGETATVTITSLLADVTIYYKRDSGTYN